ncbi:MAG: zf-TFIIB domain-containing protein [Nanoarchaeota archaeon]|nr:zf-TFIIB domain-containing protein [Nanoarchaeota archaeon]
MEKKIKCPRCSLFINKWMRKIEHPSGATLDVCDRCGGMWLDKEEVALLSKVKKK